MIIDDSISFFGIYYHNCVFNLGLSESFKELYNKEKYLNVVLCQKDEKQTYLMTQNITQRTDSKKSYMQSYYFADKDSLKKGFDSMISSKIAYAEKTFYLIESSNRYTLADHQDLINIWKEEVRSACK